MISKKWQEDVFVGRRLALEWSIVCMGYGQFSVMVKMGPNALAVVYRYNVGHYGLVGILATSVSNDGGCNWLEFVQVVFSGEDICNLAFGINVDGIWVLVYWKAGLYCYELSDDGTMIWKWRSV